MEDFAGYITKLERLAARAVPADPADYSQDGLLYCGHCRTPKECRVDIGGRQRVLRCMCACSVRREEAEKARKQQEGEAERAERLRFDCIADKGLRACRFETAQDSPLLRKCRSYVESWESARRDNVGILLWGGTGGGKTFAAACIANALVDRGIPALVTSFPSILAAGWEEREKFLKNMNRFPLLVLDDFGTERRSEYAGEVVYSVIDRRYKSGKPLIVTTNLPLEALRNPAGIEQRRVYDRILEMCIPVLAKSAAYRNEKAAQKLRTAQAIFGGEPLVETTLEDGQTRRRDAGGTA